MFHLPQMHVLLKSDNQTHGVDYLVDGSVVWHREAVLNSGADQTWTDADGLPADVTVTLRLNGDVFLNEPLAGGTQAHVVNPDGIIVVQEVVSGAETYRVDFIDQGSGLASYSANIVHIGPDWYAQFAAPINEQVGVLPPTDGAYSPKERGTIINRFMLASIERKLTL